MNGWIVGGIIAVCVMAMAVVALWDGHLTVKSMERGEAGPATEEERWHE